MGNYMVLSKHGGWVTIDDKSLNRKNAPEVLKVPMSETEKMKFKPTWMEKNLKFMHDRSTDYIYYPNQKAIKHPGVDKSIFEIGSYRHNLATKFQM